MHMNKLFQLSVGAGYGLSKNKTDGEIGHSTVTPPRSEGSVALGSEMLSAAKHLCAQRGRPFAEFTLSGSEGLRVTVEVPISPSVLFFESP